MRILIRLEELEKHQRLSEGLILAYSNHLVLSVELIRKRLQLSTQLLL
jgi:hypothetical protein